MGKIRIDINGLHKDFMSLEKSEYGNMADVLITLIQSCEVINGDYCLLLDKEDLHFKCIEMILDLTHVVSNLTYTRTSPKGVTFDNGSRILFEYDNTFYYENMFCLITENTSVHKLRDFQTNTKLYFENSYRHTLIHKFFNKYDVRLIKYMSETEIENLGKRYGKLTTKILRELDL